MTSSNVIEILEEIKTEYRYNRYEEALKDAIAIIKKYAEIKKIVDKFYIKTKRDNSFNTTDELKGYLVEYRSHQLCLANQLLDILQEEEWHG